MKGEAIISLFLWLLYHHLAVSAAVSISSYPTPLHVIEGNAFTLTCNFNQLTFVSWRHPHLGEITQSTGHVTVQVVNDGQRYSNLIVTSPTQSIDEGDYTCSVQTSAGVVSRTTVQARLYPEVVITTPDNQVFYAREEETATVTLPCVAENNSSQITWSRVSRSGNLMNSSDGHIVVYPDRMVISNVRFSDNGTYVCKASNRADFAYILVHLIVHIGAQVSASPSVSSVAEGGRVQFEFRVRGSPFPTVEWFKTNIGDSFRIDLSPKLENEIIDTITTLYTLTFTDARSSDTGTYICRVGNEHGSRVSAQITLQLDDALGPPQHVRASLVNQTKINVTWSPPDGSDMVETYTVVWSSRVEPRRSYVVNGNILHYVIDDGLTRLTQYTIYVYASNTRKGKGSDSQRFNITTDAVLPAAPRQVTVMDIGPTSVRLEWVFGDDGGAPITHIHVEFLTLTGVSGFVDIAIEPGQSSALIEGLKDNFQYQLGLQARNRIGLGEQKVSEAFPTAPPGRPGSPSHVTATWMSHDHVALVCWKPSEVGKPFLSYTIEVLEVKSNVTKLWKLAASVVKDNLPNCTAGYTVNGLLLDVCYKFQVVVSNSQGQGFPSDYSEELCLPSGLLSQRAVLDTKYVVIIAIALSLVLVAAIVFFAWCICVRVRHSRSTAKFPTGSLPTDDMRRSSSRSDRILLDPSSEELRFHHQISIGSYTSSGSGNSVNGEETPNTAATVLSNNAFTFDMAGSKNQPTFTQDHMQNFAGGRSNRSGSATLPIMNGSTLYPIPENDLPSQTLPFHATPPHYPYASNDHLPSYSYFSNAPPSNVGPGSKEKFEDELVEMTDNPLNDEFEKKMLAGGHVSRPNFSHEIDLPEDEPPPYVPPYRGDDSESEMSIPIGESCSLPPRSPQLSFKQQNNNRNRTNHDRAASHHSLHDHTVMTPASFNISCSDNELREEEDTEFIDNEAYQKVQESGFTTRPHEGEGGRFGSQNNMLGSSTRCSPVVTVEGRGSGYGSQQQVIEDDDDVKPRFKIKRGGRRGDVFEKVELHH